MSQFIFNFQEGIQHITDFNGWDHMLFLIVLCAGYSLKEWKKLIWIITAFTVGHTITLVLAGLDLVRFSSAFIEVLIPCTILLTAGFKLWVNKNADTPKRDYDKITLLLVISFGLIHGLGFSSYFRMITSQNSEMLSQLLFFNFGVEVGQLILVIIILLISQLAVRVLAIKRGHWSRALLIAGIAGSCWLLGQKFLC